MGLGALVASAARSDLTCSLIDNNIPRPGSGENVVSRDIRRDFTGEWVVAAAGVDTSSHVARPARIARSLRGEG